MATKARQQRVPNRSLIWLILSAFAALGVVGATPSSQQEPLTSTSLGGLEDGEIERGEATSTSPTTSADQALMNDALTIAQQDGESADVVLERLRAQDRFGSLLGELAQGSPETFGGGWSDTLTNGAPVFYVRYVGEVPSEAIEAADRHKLEVEFKEQSESSEATLQTRADQLHDDLLASGHREVVTSYAIHDQSIFGVARRTPSQDGKTDQQLASELPERSRTSDIRIEYTRAPVAGYTHTRAGAWMWDSDSRDCTSGFSVKRRTDNTPGVTTAGHCESISRYEEPGFTPYNAPFVREHRGEYGDVEWHTTSHDEFAEFHATSTEIRNVLSVETVSAVAENDDYCAYGRKTNKKRCDKVFLVNVSSTFDGITHKRLTAMQKFQADFGDSGGPWFIGNKAAGIQSGWVVLNGVKYETWSKVGYLGNALDVFVFTK